MIINLLPLGNTTLLLTLDLLRLRFRFTLDLLRPTTVFQNILLSVKDLSLKLQKNLFSCALAD